MDNFSKLIEMLCKEKNIKITTVSNNWVRILEKDDKIRYIFGFSFDLNSTAITKILADKFALYDTLSHFNIGIIKHHLLYPDYDKKMVLDLFDKYNKNVVVKANLGSCGKEVFHVTNRDDLFNKMDELLENNYSISLCPYYDIKNEYRVIIVGDSIELMYYKIKPEVKGDGRKTINELLREFNPSYFNDKDVSNEVLAKDEVYSYNWKFNLSQGASSNLNVDPKKRAILEKITHEILQKIPVKFCSIDIIETNGEFLVLEINSIVTTKRFVLQHDECHANIERIYSKVLDLLFEN